jgi:DNA-binding response OmpR family regulator
VTKILIIDDNSSLRTLVRTLLERAGHAVTEAADGLEGVRRLYAERPDLVILDLHMPGIDGWAALARIRELSDVPVLMLSAAGNEEERTRGLLEGADDFQRKPFGGPELLARVTALLRRSRPGAIVPEVVDDGWARVDVQRHEAVVDGAKLRVTPLEFRLLGVFLRHPGVALTHEQLIELVWQDAFGTREQVKVAVLALRRKLDSATRQGSAAIETVRGVGYRWAGAAVVAA